MNSSVKGIVGLVGCFALIGCDAITKTVALESLGGGGSVEVVPGVLDLKYAENTGMAFSAFAGSNAPLLILIASLSLLLLLMNLVQHFWAEERTRAEWWAFSFIVAGAVGNVVDRVRRGHVIDFIHLHHWPIFNLADILIVAGGLLYLRERLRRPAEEPDDSR